MIHDASALNTPCPGPESTSSSSNIYLGVSVGVAVGVAASVTVFYVCFIVGRQRSGNFRGNRAVTASSVPVPAPAPGGEAPRPPSNVLVAASAHGADPPLPSYDQKITPPT